MQGKYFGSEDAGEITYRFRPVNRHNLVNVPVEILISSERLGGVTIERSQENHELFDKAYTLITQIIDNGSPATQARLLDALI